MWFSLFYGKILLVMFMKFFALFFIAISIIALAIFVIVFIIQIRARKFLKEFFNASSFREAFENSETEAAETPKSVSSMDSLYVSQIEKDFPDLNINELKSNSEKVIIDTLNAIENKDRDCMLASDKINSYIRSKIDDLKDGSVIYDNIKIHKTVVNKYEKSDKIATIYFASSVEYFYKKNNEAGKKVQTRFKCEYIYIIDSEKIGNVKALGLNCPNCGAPIKTLGHKHCEYCNTGVIDIVKKTWIINNIKEY